MALTYRLHRAEDLPGLRQLWRDNTDWGTITEQMWQQHVVEAPLGGSSILVAVDDATGDLVGSFVFVPSMVSVDGREFFAFRPAAPVVAKGHRFFGINPLEHPVVTMYQEAVKAMRGRGDGLIYMVPDPRWVRLFKMFPGLLAGTFPLWSMRLPLSHPLPLGAGYESGPLDLADPRIDGLWQEASRLHGCSIVRDRRSLPWKIGKGDDLILGIEREGALMALVASRQKGDRQWLVTDLVFADVGGSLRAALAAVCNLAHGHLPGSDPERPIQKVAVLATPIMEPVVREMGFFRDKYDFPLVIQSLNPELSERDVDPARWFVSAND